MTKSECKSLNSSIARRSLSPSTLSSASIRLLYFEGRNARLELRFLDDLCGRPFDLFLDPFPDLRIYLKLENETTHITAASNDYGDYDGGYTNVDSPTAGEFLIEPFVDALDD